MCFKLASNAKGFISKLFLGLYLNTTQLPTIAQDFEWGQGGGDHLKAGTCDHGTHGGHSVNMC